MGFNALLFCFGLLLAWGPARAAVQDVKDVTWAQFREEVAARKLNGRGIAIRLADGALVRTTLRRVEADGLVVGLTPQVEKRWKPKAAEAKVPREEVETAQFSGRQGHGGLIGILAGLGTGGLALGVAVAQPGEGNQAGAALLLPPVLGVTRHLIGRRFDTPIPRFRIVP